MFLTMSALREHTAPGKEQNLPQRRNNANVNRKKERKGGECGPNERVSRGGRDGENYKFDAGSLLASGATLPSSVTMATEPVFESLSLSPRAISFSRLSPGADALGVFSLCGVVAPNCFTLGCGVQRLFVQRETESESSILFSVSACAFSF